MMGIPAHHLKLMRGGGVSALPQPGNGEEKPAGGKHNVGDRSSPTGVDRVTAQREI